MQVFFKETTPLSLKLICDDIKYDFDTTLNEDTIQINCRSLFSNLLVKHKKIENIRIKNLLIKDLILLNNIDILKQLNVNENYNLKKSQSSKNIPPIVKIPNETKVEQNKEFIWEDDTKENCKLCSRFNQINERPNSGDDDIVVNKHGAFQYRIVYHQNGHLMTVLSNPIKYCLICGRKLEI